MDPKPTSRLSKQLNIHSTHTDKEMSTYTHTQIKILFKIDWESNNVFSLNTFDVSDLTLKVHKYCTLYA